MNPRAARGRGRGCGGGRAWAGAGGRVQAGGRVRGHARDAGMRRAGRRWRQARQVRTGDARRAGATGRPHDATHARRRRSRRADDRQPAAPTAHTIVRSAPGAWTCPRNAPARRRADIAKSALDAGALVLQGVGVARQPTNKKPNKTNAKTRVHNPGHSHPRGL